MKFRLRTGRIVIASRGVKERAKVFRFASGGGAGWSRELDTQSDINKAHRSSLSLALSLSLYRHMLRRPQDRCSVSPPAACAPRALALVRGFRV